MFRNDHGHVPIRQLSLVEKPSEQLGGRLGLSHTNARRRLPRSLVFGENGGPQLARERKRGDFSASELPHFGQCCHSLEVTH